MSISAVRFFLSVLLTGVAVVVLSLGVVQAQEQQEFRIVVLDLPPFGYMDENGEVAGLCADVGNLIAEEAGFVPKNRLAPLTRALYMLQHGEADMCILFPTKDAQEVAVSAGVPLPLEIAVWGRAGSSWQGLEDLDGLSVVQIRGANYDDRVTCNDRIKKTLTSSYAHSLEMLMHGRADAVVGPLQALMHVARQKGYGPKDFGEPLVLSIAPGTAFVSNQCPHLIKIADALKRLEEQNAFASIRAKYSF